MYPEALGVTLFSDKMPQNFFWHGFLPYFDGIEVSQSLKMKYLAYIALLAGWLIFCYWLYAKELYPRFHPPKEKSWPILDPDLNLPLAFYWGSKEAVAGQGFEEWERKLLEADSLQHFIIFKSHFFRDEAKSVEEGKLLAKKRVDQIIRFANLDSEKVMTEIHAVSVSSDARHKPTESVQYEIVDKGFVRKMQHDTLEICFPIKDSIQLPAALLNEVDRWIDGNFDKINNHVVVTGTADGTGISESADMAWERANLIKERLLRKGWADEKIALNTGQRNLEIPIRNRCVMMFFE